MSAATDKQDLRVQRTRKALKNALLSLLGRQKFEKITVNDLCEEAIVSRTGFYAHFRDKYDLLNHTLEEIKTDIEDYERKHTDSENVKNIDEYIRINSTLMKNIVDESNVELMNLLIELLKKDVRARLCSEGELSAYDNALVNFCAGGFANLLLWQMRNDFPLDGGNFGVYVDRMLKTLRDSRS